MKNNRLRFFIGGLIVIWGGYSIAVYFVAHKPFAIQLIHPLAALFGSLTVTGILTINAFSLGRVILGWMVRSDTPDSSHIILAGGIGLGALGLLGFGLAIVGATSPLTLLFVQIALFVFLIWRRETKQGLIEVIRLLIQLRDSASTIPTWMKWAAALALRPRSTMGLPLAAAPDGRRVVFVASAGGAHSLWVWSAEDGATRRLEGTEGATSPFFSPDGREIAFFVADELRRISVTGGPATRIAVTPSGQSGTWGAAGTILFTRWLGPEAGLWSVPAGGGEPHRLVSAARRSDLRAFPSFLPDGRHYLFLSGGMGGMVGSRKACVASIDGGEPECVPDCDSQAAYSCAESAWTRAACNRARVAAVRSARALPCGRGQPGSNRVTRLRPVRFDRYIA